MKAIARFERAIGGLPIGHLVDYRVVLGLAVALLLLGACSTVPAPATPTDAPMSAHDAAAARAMALQKIGESAKDAETQRLAIFAVMALGQAGNAAPPPAPVIVQNRSVGDALIGFVGRVFDGAERLAAPYLAYRGQVRSAETTEKVAAINRDVSIAQTSSFLQLGVAGINGTAAAGTAGVNALATVASRPAVPSTQVTVTGNTGPVLVGPGTQTNSSNNPVNPAPVVCAPGTGGAIGCSR